MSRFFASGGQSIGISALASVLPMNIQDRYPLGWTGCISLQSKGLSRVFSNTTVQKHQFVGTLAAAAAAKSLQSCPTLCDPTDGSPPGSPPWDSPGKNTGVGCHFLLQCMNVKNESEVAQWCLTLSDPMDCSPPGPSIQRLPHCKAIILQKNYDQTKSCSYLRLLKVFRT